LYFSTNLKEYEKIKAFSLKYIINLFEWSYIHLIIS
jgi:hypothetical protein